MPGPSAEPDTSPPSPAFLAAETGRLAGPDFGAETPLAVAVSGGADSLALMWLAAQAFGRRAHVLSVDHGLRPEAAAECATVSDLAAELGLPHETLALKMAAGGDVQARARGARYAAMGEWCGLRGIRLLLTGHQADDQAETLLMRLSRGSGLVGLQGVRPRLPLGGLLLLRPLLHCRRAELAAVVKAAGWTPVEDPSNADLRFDRARARALLERTRWLSAPRLAASAAHLADAAEALDWAAARAFETRNEASGESLLLDPEGLPPELRRRLLMAGLAAKGVNPEGPSLARLLARLEAGGGGTLGPLSARARPDGRWQLAPAAPRRLRS